MRGYYDSASITMNDVFQRLDKSRHLPAFPLEARSEVFFALFLPTVLEKSRCVGVKVKPQIVPQFPLKHEGSNQSNNVDFFALSECEKHAFLIELKTDMRSIDKKQKCYLRRAKCRGMRKVMEDLKTIAQVERPEHLRRKYFHLLSALDELGLTKLPCELKRTMYADDSTGVYKLIENIEILKSPILEKPEVVYVQPRPCEENKVKGFKYIYFDEFADIVESQGDMGGLFAGYLRKWKEDPAKSPPR